MTKAMRTQLTERRFDAGEVTLSYAEGPPTGPPVVLLHGSSSRRQTWDAVIGALAPAWTVYALDARGHGKSGRATTGYRFVDFSRDLTAFLRHRVGEPSVLVGHSLGAMTSIKTAADAPERVRALVLEEPAPYLFQEWLRQWVGWAEAHTWYGLASSGGSAEEMARSLMTLHPRFDETSARARAAALATVDLAVFGPLFDESMAKGFDTDRLLTAIECPVLLIHGASSLGSTMRPEDVERVSSCLRNSTVVGFPEQGHSIHRPKVREFVKILGAFLDDV